MTTQSEPQMDPEELLRWAELRDELPYTSLEPLRSSAEKWGASITALLGVFGTVAFVKGPEALTDIPAQFRLAVTLAIAVAGLLAGVAIVLAALAAQGVPKWRTNLTPQMLARETKAAQRSTVAWLSGSRWAALAAAALLFASTVGVWVIQALEDPSEGATVEALVIDADGTARCGELTRDASGTLRLAAEPSGSPQPLSMVMLVSEVEACPSD